MINKNIVTQPKSIIEVQISAPWSDIEPTWTSTLQRLANDVEISGFRKGTAPLTMVEQQLGQKLPDEVLNTLMPQFLMESLKGTDIIPIDYPKYEITSFVKGQGVQFKATITNRPKVSVGDYKTIKVTKTPPKPVTEEEVTKVLDDLYSRWKSRQPAIPASNQAIQQPSQPINGNPPLPEVVQLGQTVSTPPVVQPVPESEGPDDSFAKVMGAADLNDLKTKIRKDLEDNISFNAELDFEESILQEIEKITNVEIPEVLIEDELNRMLISLQRRVADMGLLMEDYLKGQGKTLDQLKTEWRAQAEKNVRMELGLAEVARNENVNISDAELQLEIDKIQDQKVKQQFDFQEPRLQLRHALRQTRTLDLLKKLVVA